MLVAWLPHGLAYESDVLFQEKQRVELYYGVGDRTMVKEIPTAVYPDPAFEDFRRGHPWGIAIINGDCHGEVR